MLRPSVLLLLTLLPLPGQPGATQAIPPPPDERIVRVWLGSPGPFAPGEPVRVYVQTAEDGYLMVLRSGTDGVIRVLYPSHPRDPQLGAYTRAGTYEIRAAGETVAFKIDEPLGTGRVLAALSSQPYRSEEFVHQTSWNPDALVGTGGAGDVEGAMTDILQRMLGAGYFTYDVVEYAVAQRPYAAQAPGYPPTTPDAPPAYPEYYSPGNFVSVIVIDPFLALPCDPYYSVCVGFPFVGYRPAPRRSGLCSFGEECWRQDRTIALAGGRNPALRAGSIPRRPYAARAGAAVAARRTTLVPDARTVASLRRSAAPTRSASGAVPSRSAVQRVRAATPTLQAVAASAPVAIARPASPSTRPPHPVARARPRVAGAALAPAPAPQRARAMSYRPLPARVGTAAPSGPRAPAAGSARAAAGARSASRAVVPSRAVVRRR